MEIKEIHNLTAGKVSLQKKTETDNAFNEIFNQKLSSVLEVKPQTHSDAKIGLIDQSKRVINLLDEYANELKKPEKSLKEIEPLVKAIEKEVSLVERKAADPVYKDDDITGIINDLSVTANVALYKFQRGDFIY